MFTVKIYYQSGQTNLYACDSVNVSGSDLSLSLFGPGEKGNLLTLDGTETVYVENEAGKTVHVIKPQSRPV